MDDLTERQSEVLDFILDSITGRGFPPTMGEIGERFGVTAGAVYQYLNALEKKGHIERCKGKRAITLKKYRMELKAV